MKLLSFDIRTKIVGLFVIFVLLFMGFVFLWVLPRTKQVVMTQKQDQLKYLVQGMVSLLNEYHKEEQEGKLSRAEAQQRALKRIKEMRYGPEGKDYFWINDFGPRMVMHPFRPDLDGKDLSDYKDPHSKALFVEFVQTCRGSGSGFVEYMWQWKDDKTRIVPKLSYVQAFSPWGWIIGTGLYINDVMEEMASLRNSFLLAIIPIVLIILGLLAIPMRHLGRLNSVAAGLFAASEEVNSAAGRISGVSQTLSEGASEQAASLEETSASLEELASMTRTNADNARQADALMGETAKVVDHANQSMGSLTQSMREVSVASEETAKIIKTIDEIAFQTNLLALNAAVEAARAGEAGAGFAVVADEVRNLAMRAAEAARNTAELIETTVAKVKHGSDLVTRTAAAFSQVAGSANKVKELVAEIAAASGEQAQGVEQVNKAVAEMNQVTQQTAASAEESAGAAEQLSAQSEQMKAVVRELVALVGGGTAKINGHHPAPEGKSGVLKAQLAARRPALVRPGSPAKTLAPEQVIPLEEDNFKDF